MTQSKTLLQSGRYLAAKQELLQTILESSAPLRGIRPPSSTQARQEYLEIIQEFQKNRGRDLYYPYLSSGLGAGPFVELTDGSVKLDLITGIGVQFFGHAHPAMISEMIDGLGSDLWQGNLQPGDEAQRLIKSILSKVGLKSRLKNAWLTTCGTMANEIALKLIRQKKNPATQVVAFKDCFAGRSTAMQEITDNPAYRQGQPHYGEVVYLPFYDQKQTLSQNTDQALTQLNQYVAQQGDRLAALMIELVQGEGGFNFAPREWYVSIFEAAKKAGLMIWVDEIQTFGRTGHLFAYQYFGLEEYVDIVTVAKMLQASVVIYTEELNPKPGLVAGTFTGTSMALRSARKVIELLHDEGYLGKTGKIARLSEYFVKSLESLKTGSCQGKIGEIRAIGGMIAFLPFDGKLEQVKAVLMKLFDLGVVAFYCGHGPYMVRMLPPLGAMTEQDIDLACSKINEAILGVDQP